jgi:Lrp/AsnC family transcriptional regulator
MVELDEMDRRILSLLQADASLSTAELADRVGLSPSPCWRRVKRLREAGVIQREVSLLDPRAVGLGVTVLASVTLARHSEDSVRQFEAAILDAPEVMECHAVTGERDYMLRIAVADIEAYDRFLNSKLLNLSAVSSVNSRFALRRVKYSTALPLPPA